MCFTELIRDWKEKIIQQIISTITKMTFTSIQSMLPEKAKIEKLKKVKTRRDLRDVYAVEKMKKNLWNAMPDQILFDERISEGAKVLWLILQCVSDCHGYSFFGQRRLAALIGKSRKSVQRFTQELKQAGWLEVKPGGYNRSNSYCVLWPYGCQNPKLTSAIRKSRVMANKR